MARYLSREWFEEIETHTASSDSPPVAVLEQVVQDGPEGSVTYRVEVGGGQARIVWPVPDRAPSPDLRFTCDWTTAVAIARGELSTQRALMQGRLRVKGSPARLAEMAGDLSGVDPVPAAVRTSTSYPNPN